MSIQGFVLRVFVVTGFGLKDFRGLGLRVEGLGKRIFLFEGSFKGSIRDSLVWGFGVYAFVQCRHCGS